MKVCSCYFSSLSVFRFHSACQTATALQFYLTAASHSGANEAAIQNKQLYPRGAALFFFKENLIFRVFLQRDSLHRQQLPFFAVLHADRQRLRPLCARDDRGNAAINLQPPDFCVWSPGLSIPAS